MKMVWIDSISPPIIKHNFIPQSKLRLIFRQYNRGIPLLAVHINVLSHANTNEFMKTYLFNGLAFVSLISSLKIKKREHFKVRVLLVADPCHFDRDTDTVFRGNINFNEIDFPRGIPLEYFSKVEKF